MALKLEEMATLEGARPPQSSPLAFTDTAAGGAAGPGDAGGGPLRTGRQLAHFRVERLLGAGGMGEVYLATDLALDRPVALKVVAQGTATVARRERLIREARAQARIHHPNVCHIYFIGESDGLLFFAMELVAGKTLAEVVGQGPLAPDEAVELVRMAALGLREATRCGFTHRDVKPSNLMVDAHGNVKVMDFGLVAGDSASAESGGSVEQTSMAGTPLYMAPEQARGEAIDFRADIYALGATLYHLVAGKPPFAGNTVAELLQQHSIADRPALVRSDLASRALQPLQGLCARMMAPDPAARPASYDDLLRELELISTARNRPAGATVRTAAMAIDTFVLLPLLWAVTWALSEGLQRELDGMIAFSLTMPLYRLALLAWRGRTLGQAIFELEVIDLGTGTKPSRRQAARRMVYQFGLLVTASLMWSVSGARAGWLETIGEALVPTVTVLMLMTLYLSSWRHAKRRTWWDRRSDTMVRYRPR